MKFDNINIKELLKSLDIKASEFSYSHSYMDGHYMSVTDELMNFEIGFGAKTKSKKIALIIAHKEAANKILKTIDSPYLIGDQLNTSEKNVIYDQYTIKPQIEKDIIIGLFISHTPTIEENSQFLNLKKKIDKIIEPVGNEDIKKKLIGIWSKSLSKSDNYNLTVPQRTKAKYSKEFHFLDINENSIISCLPRYGVTHPVDSPSDEHTQISPLDVEEKTTYIYPTDKLKKFPYKISKLYNNGCFIIKFYNYNRLDSYKIELKDDLLILHEEGFVVAYTKSKKDQYRTMGRT